jgi:hypothetical protein
MQFNRFLFGIKYSVSGSSGTNAVIFFYDKVYVVNLEIVMNELRTFGHVSYFLQIPPKLDRQITQPIII